MKKLTKDSYVCHCGGAPAPHKTGSPNCYRFVVTEPKEIPTNRRRIYNPAGGFDEPTWVWDVGGQTITEYTLFYQRMYSVDINQVWTRPKSRDSVNSLEGDW